MKQQIIIALAFAASAAFGWEAALPLVSKVTGGSGGAVDESPVHPGYAANADTSLFVRVYSPEGVNPYGLAADVQKTREFVYRMAALGSSRYVTATAVPGEPFPTYAAMTNAVATHTAANPKLFYNGAAVEPTKDDWCVVLKDETHTNATTGEPQTTRWGFVGEFGAGGQFQFQIVLSGTSFTTEQMAAIDSTVTKDDVDWGRFMRTNGLDAALAEKRDKDDLATYGRFDVPASWRSDETNGSVRAYPYTGTSGTPGTSGYRYNWGMTDARARQVSYYPNRGLLNVTVAGIGNTNLTVAAGKDPMSDDPVASDLGGPYRVAENMGGLFTFIAKRKGVVLPDGGRLATVSNLVEAVEWAARDATNYVDVATNGLVSASNAQEIAVREIDKLAVPKSGARMNALSQIEFYDVSDDSSAVMSRKVSSVKGPAPRPEYPSVYRTVATSTGVEVYHDPDPRLVGGKRRFVSVTEDGVSMGTVPLGTSADVEYTVFDESGFKRMEESGVSGTNRVLAVSAFQQDRSGTVAFVEDVEDVELEIMDIIDVKIAANERSGEDNQIVRGKFFEDVWYINVERAQSAGSAGSADTATQATNDGYGNNIVETYARKDEIPPPPGNYAAVSNAAMTAHQDATNYTDAAIAANEKTGTDEQIIRGGWSDEGYWAIDVDRAEKAHFADDADYASRATFDAFGDEIAITYARKDEIPPPPGNYTAVSNAAMTAHQDATNYTDSAVNALIGRIAAAAASLDPSRSSVSNIIMVLKSLGQ